MIFIYSNCKEILLQLKSHFKVSICKYVYVLQNIKCSLFVRFDLFYRFSVKIFDGFPSDCQFDIFYYKCNFIFSKRNTYKVTVLFNIYEKYLFQIILIFNATSKVKGNEQTFTEEYQNINLTNKIIEKLLQNYEILKSMYKSQDMLHSSSSFEENSTYKNPQREKTPKPRNRSLKKIINFSETSPRPGTAMIYGSASSHEEASSSVEKAKDEKNIGKNQNQKRVKFENILEYNKKQESKVFESKESESNDEIDELPLEMPTTKYVLNKLKQNVINVKKPFNKKHKSKHNDLGEKTRFDILKQHKKQKHKSLRTDNDPNTRRIKKVVYSELFSPHNIWYEVINKPIKLNIDMDPFSQKQKAYEKQDAGEKLSVYILNSSTKVKKVL